MVGGGGEKIQDLALPTMCFNESEVKAAQPCLTLRDSMDYRIHGVLQARILEWVPFPFSSGSSRPRNRTRVSCIAGGFLTS